MLPKKQTICENRRLQICKLPEKETSWRFGLVGNDEFQMDGEVWCQQGFFKVHRLRKLNQLWYIISPPWEALKESAILLQT